MNNPRPIRIKYSCKCIRTNIANLKDWEDQPQEDIKDASGRIIMSVYKYSIKCSECVKKQQHAGSMQ